MSIYSATIDWQCDRSDFVKRRYSRVHKWHLDGGITLKASASPYIVPAPMSVVDAIDPEEAFIASLSSCHMLFFLDYASRAKISILSYVDIAHGFLEKNEDGKSIMTKIILNPVVEYKDEMPDKVTIKRLHHQAHEDCFLANSVKTQIQINLDG